VFAVTATTLLVYFQRDQYQDNTGTPVDFVDALYFATVSLSTTGYGDITPATDQARLVNIFLITPLRVLFLIVLVGTTLEVLTTRTREEFRETRWKKKLKDHVVVIGYGVKGRSAVRMMMDNGVPPGSIVVIAGDAAAVEDANRPSTMSSRKGVSTYSRHYPGVAAILGDARREEVLNHAQVATAAKVIVAVDQDDAAILITLAVRKLAPQAKLTAAAREQSSAAVLRQSGADQVITTAEAAGRLLGMQLVHPIAGELMEDLLDPGEGLEVREREVTRAEWGKSTTQLAEEGEMVLAVRRTKRDEGLLEEKVYRFNAGDMRVLQKGDRVVIIRTRVLGPQPGPVTRRHVGSLNQHVVIGYGVKGRAAVRMMLDNGIEPDKIVVVADDAASVEQATRPSRKNPDDEASRRYPGVAGILGDARRKEVLEHADVPGAGKVIVAVDRDDVAVLVTLAVRELAPATQLIAAAREQTSANVLRQSGADRVITTAEAAGRLLGMQLVYPVAGDLMEDLLDPSEGLEVVEREVGRTELGMSREQLARNGEMLLAVERDSLVYRFDTESLHNLQKGDTIVTIREGHRQPIGSEFAL
jgi:voltage-gated potassium channel